MSRAWARQAVAEYGARRPDLVELGLIGAGSGSGEGRTPGTRRMCGRDWNEEDLARFVGDWNARFSDVQLRERYGLPSIEAVYSVAGELRVLGYPCVESKVRQKEERVREHRRLVARLDVRKPETKMMMALRRFLPPKLNVSNLQTGATEYNLLGAYLAAPRPRFRLVSDIPPVFVCPECQAGNVVVHSGAVIKRLCAVCRAEMTE